MFGGLCVCMCAHVCYAYQLLLGAMHEWMCMCLHSTCLWQSNSSTRAMWAQVRHAAQTSLGLCDKICHHVWVNSHICPRAFSSKVWKLVKAWDVSECVCIISFLLSQPLVKEPFRTQVEFLQLLLTLLSSSLPLWLPPSFLHLCLIISPSFSVSSPPTLSFSPYLCLVTALCYLLPVNHLHRLIVKNV